jgi:hypothetical protein
VEEYFRDYKKYFNSIQLKLSVSPEDLENYNTLQNKINEYRKNMIFILRDFIKRKEDFYDFILYESE